jgi:hypothetical protein
MQGLPRPIQTAQVRQFQTRRQRKAGLRLLCIGALPDPIPHFLHDRLNVNRV